MERDMKRIVQKLLAIFDEIESYEFHKQNMIISADKLFREYQEGKYTHVQYQKLLHDILKKKPKEWWISYYNSYISTLLTHADPLISQIIVYAYNDDAASRLRLSAAGAGQAARKPAKEKEAVEKHISLEEDKADLLKQLGRLGEEKGEFVQIEKAGVLGKIKSSLQLAREEKQEPPKVDLGELRELGDRTGSRGAKKGISRLARARIWFDSYLERRKLSRGKRQIAKELGKVKRLSALDKAVLALKRGAVRKAAPVEIREPLFQKILNSMDSLFSSFRKKERLEFKGIEAKIAPEEKPAKVQAPHAGFAGPKKDKALEKLFSGLERINREPLETKVKVPRESLKLKIDMLIIRVHALSRKRRIARRAKVSVKGPALFSVLSARISESLDALLEKLRLKKPSAAKEEEVSRLKEELTPEKVRGEIVLEAPKPQLTAYQRIYSGAKELLSPVISLLFVKREAPAKDVKGAPAPEKAAAPEEERVRFKFGIAAIKAWYSRKAEREKAFITKKTSITPSMQLEALKSRITVPMEAEKITHTLLREEVESIKKIVEGGKRFKVYEPSIIGSFANVLIRRFTFYLLNRFPGFFKELYDNLRLSNVPVLSNTYVNIMVLMTLFSTFASMVLFLLFFLLTRNALSMAVFKAIVMGVLVGGTSLLLFYMYPQIRASGREKDIKTNLPFAINHISAVAGSGVPPTKMFGLLVESEEYGEVAIEIEKIVEYIELFGYDLLTAIRSVASTTPSTVFKEFLEGIVSTIEAGGDIKEYLKQKAAEAMMSYELEREEYTETIATLSDVYTGILIAAPLFFIVALSLVSMLGGTIGGFSVNSVIVVGGYVVIPILNIGFVMLLELTQPEM